MKLSQKWFHHPTPVSWVGTPFFTPPPSDVAPKPSLNSHSTQATRTSEKPANIIASTFTAHFFGTIEA